MPDDFILRIEWANVMKLERVRMSSEGSERLYAAWKVLKQFHLVRYDESIRGAMLLRMAS